MELVPLYKRLQEVSSLLLPCEDAVPVNQEVGSHQTLNTLVLDLGRLASRTVRHKCLLLKPCRLRCSAIKT